METTFTNNLYDNLIHLGQRITVGLFSITTLQVLYVVLSLVVIALITLILFLFVRMYELHREAALKKKPVVTPAAMPTTGASGDVPAAVENATWKHIRERLLGDNPGEWKLAVIEADIYMDRCLDDKGFHGDTTGDKLKQVTPDRLPSIQIAWEVHKVRNRIAHDGADFVLTMPEARRMLSYYEIIFTDLGVL